MVKFPKSILITGASSGLGAALATDYAATGVTLHLGGRHEGRLSAVAELCRAKGAVVHTAAVDVADREAMAAWIDVADATAPLDLAIANAAVTGGLSPGNKPEEIARAQRLFSVNLFGVMNTIHPAMDRMIERKNGQVVIVSSLAGYRGFPFSPAYSASKSALRIYGEALRSVLTRYNVTLSVVCPGFMDTPWNDPIDAPMPFLMSVENAAALVRRKLGKGKRLICFPRRLYWLTLLLVAVPRSISDYFMSRMSVSIPQTDAGPDHTDGPANQLK
jgi:short-subunit dehydrogenase